MAAGLSSCANNRNIAKTNKPVLYNPATTSLHPKVSVFHVSDVESQMFILLNTNELIVNEANEEKIPRTEVKIHYQLFDCTDTENNKIISDSATFVNLVQVTARQKLLVFPVLFPATQGRRYMLMIQVTDLLRRNSIRQFLTVDKTSEYAGQNFRLTHLNGSPKPENYVNENDIFRIVYRRNAIDRIFIKYMATVSPIATSPLAAMSAPELVFRADSVWEQPYSPTTNFMFGYEGLYLIQADTTQREGLLLMNFGTSFPKENRTAQLLEPIQYFLNPAEYQRLQEEGNPKKRMDRFWLATTGSTDKARMLIRVFYTRMAYANQYFTDLKEGWKTDRGIVYMVYGLPDNVLKSSDSETWEYTRKHSKPITFLFDRKDTPYASGYYVLRRGDPQSTYWAAAVQSWRKGKVFNISELEE
ncbi:MAG: GWxTD domain-containing protein [Bacteroidales bacterium]|nr:GWxTD domain-containing protein [Bacteroidales bacterium]